MINPRALCLWSLAALVCLLSSTNVVERAAVVLVASNVLLATRRRHASLRLTCGGIGVAAVMTSLLVVLESHSGNTVFLTLPSWLPLAGGPLTLQAIAYSGDLVLGVAGCLLVAAPLALALDGPDLVDALPRSLHRIAAALGVALTLVPRLTRTAVAIRESESLRGEQQQRAVPWRSVAAPAFLCAIEDSMGLAEAMEARGFGGGPRTQLSPPRWRPADMLVAVCSVAAAAVILIAANTGGLSNWSPFPALVAPNIDVAALGATLLLLVPAAVWHSQ